MTVIGATVSFEFLTFKIILNVVGLIGSLYVIEMLVSTAVSVPIGVLLAGYGASPSGTR
ncbi:hypothetical protein D3C80_2195330 [compost metagenome]